MPPNTGDIENAQSCNYFAVAIFVNSREVLNLYLITKIFKLKNVPSQTLSIFFSTSQSSKTYRKYMKAQINPKQTK